MQEVVNIMEDLMPFFSGHDEPLEAEAAGLCFRFIIFCLYTFVKTRRHELSFSSEKYFHWQM